NALLVATATRFWLGRESDHRYRRAECVCIAARAETPARFYDGDNLHVVRRAVDYPRRRRPRRDRHTDSRAEYAGDVGRRGVSTVLWFSLFPLGAPNVGAGCGTHG